MKVLDKIIDLRSNCVSVLTKMTVQEYHNLAYQSFEKNGLLSGQRGVIRSATASKIRKRMHEDFDKGAVFPQVVLGACLHKKEFEKLKKDNEANDSLPVIQTLKQEEISIIDGMQRSNIYFDNLEKNRDREIRVEFWLTDEAIRLLYRMLVLNTGQVPWNTRRQIEVIYSDLANSIKLELDNIFVGQDKTISIWEIDDKKRRSKAGHYNGSTIIEMYLCFNSRSVKIDISNALAEEYQRFDVLDSIDEDINFYYFIQCLSILISLDFAIENYSEDVTGLFSSGKDLFTRVPACVGFIVACSEFIFGKLSTVREKDEKDRRLEIIRKSIGIIISKATLANSNYLGFETLNNMIESWTKGRIGDEQRKLFKDSFMDIFKYPEIEELDSLEAIWRE